MRRVSSPDAGASSSATAAPVIAPSMNATTTVPAPPSSLAIDLLLTPLPLSYYSVTDVTHARCSERPGSADAHPHVEVLLRVLANVANQRARLAGGGIHVLI